MTILNTTVPFGVTSQDPFGIEAAFANMDAAADMISYQETESRSAVVSDNKRGEYYPQSARSNDGRDTISATYKLNDEENPGAAPVQGLTVKVGKAAPEALDSITITCPKGDFATIAVSGHKHIGGSRVNHNKSERDVEFPTFPVYGCSSFGLQIGVPEEALQSSTWTFNFGHTDDTDKDGNFLCGTTHGVSATAQFEAIDPTDWTIPENWVLTEKTPTPTQSNTAHQSRTLSITRYFDGNSVSRIVPAGGDVPSGTAPVLRFVGNLSAFSTTEGEPSAAQVLTLEGFRLQAGVELSFDRDEGFECSWDGVTWGISGDLPLAMPENGELQVPVYVRMIGGDAGSYTESIRAESGSGTSEVTATKSLSGTVTAAT